MSKNKRQELINKLSMLGYYASEEDKNSIFLCIAALYRITDDKAEILEKHVQEITDKNAVWNKDIIYKIA